MNWLAAEEGCQGLDPVAHLASVNSKAENDYIYSLYNNQNNNYLWLGGSDSYSEGNWTWNDGLSFDYDNWKSDGDSGTSRNCLAIATSYPGRYWFDLSCFDKNYFICEINMD